MNRLDFITFLSDFGCDGGYVAACEGTIVRINPRVRLLHISHEIGVGDVSAGAAILERVAPLCPPSVHLAVIDPEVGTERRPLALMTARGDVLIGPDNGLLLPAADALGGLQRGWVLDPCQVRLHAGLPADKVSSTFHGRDVFAPAAAVLSSGFDPAAYASPLDTGVLIRLPQPEWRTTSQGAWAQVIEIDRFGNVGLAVRFDDFGVQSGDLNVEIEGEGLPEWHARVVHTFGELRPGELGLYRDSWGQVALALNGASAAELLSVRRGMTVRLTKVPA